MIYTPAYPDETAVLSQMDFFLFLAVGI